MVGQYHPYMHNSDSGHAVDISIVGHRNSSIGVFEVFLRNISCAMPRECKDIPFHPESSLGCIDRNTT